MKRFGLCVITLCCCLPLAAQGPLQRVSDFFGGKKEAVADKSRAGTANRQAEILVELAWLDDPLTFPYYLDAKVEGTSMEVRGYVPNRAVRDQP